MANSWFKFKQFSISQDKAAMKVGTDGVLLGAWADVEGSQRILDIGTGTGLLALMLAQRNNEAIITAIDINQDAVIQAKENFARSKWKASLSVVHASLADFTRVNDTKFDQIICNPPFFKNAFKSHNSARNTARLNDSLPFDDLLKHACNLTHLKSRLAVVIPFEAELEFIKISERYGFFLKRVLRIQPTPSKNYSRSLIELSRQDVGQIEVSHLVVEDKGRHGYSDEYINLTKNYYLAF